MKAFLISAQWKRLPWKKVLLWFLLLMAVVLIVQTWVFLDSIHYQVGDWLWAEFGAAAPRVDNFKKYQKEFELVVKETNAFLDAHPDFFDNFNELYFVEKNGLLFDEKNHVVYDDQGCVSSSAYLHPIETEEWKTVKNFSKAFGEGYYYSFNRVSEKYPRYVFFCASEKNDSILVYTGGERPDDFINNYWKIAAYVHVRKLANGWYDIYSAGVGPEPDAPLW